MAISSQQFFTAKFIKQVFILTGILSVVLTLHHQQFQQYGASQFTNYTECNVKSQVVSTYSKKINEAYSFYGNDIKQSSQYLAKQFKEKYGWYYSVIILTNSQHIGGGWLFSSNSSCTVCWSKVNIYKPEWWYIIWAIWPYSTDVNMVGSYYDGIGKGSGVDDKKIAVIRNIISAEEQKYISCMCYSQDLFTIHERLKQFDNGLQWSILCKAFSESNLNGYLQSINYEFIQIHGREVKCEYLLVRQK